MKDQKEIEQKKIEKAVDDLLRRIENLMFRYTKGILEPERRSS